MIFGALACGPAIETKPEIKPRYRTQVEEEWTPPLRTQMPHRIVAGTSRSSARAEGWQQLLFLTASNGFLIACITCLYRMKLAEWARQQGLDYKTAYRWFPAGIPPVPSKQLPTGTILVEPVPLAEKRGAAVYATTVSSGDQKKDLERQLARLLEHATAKGLSIVKSVSRDWLGTEWTNVGLLRDATRSRTRRFRPSFGLVVTRPGSRCLMPTRRIAR